MIYDKPGWTGVLRKPGASQADSAAVLCCPCWRRGLHQNWASPCQSFCKIPFSGYPGEGKTCSALQLRAGFGPWHSQVSRHCLWSQCDSGQDCAEPAAGHRLRLGPQTPVRCCFTPSQTKAEKACGSASSSLRQDEQSASLGGCFTMYLKQRLQLSLGLRSVHLTSGDKQRAARVLEPGQG